MADREATLELPDDLRAFFWDYETERLSWEHSRHTIALRLLEKGGLQAVRWLRQHMTDAEIREFIVGRRGRGISPRRLRFWSLLVDIPRRDVDEWIESARRNPWQTRTARYPDLVPPIEWPDYGVRISALEDLACMKLSAIGGRGSKKDFIDVFALGREKFTLDQMLQFYGQKYEIADLGHTLFALTYFDDAEQDDTPEMLWQIDWDEVKAVVESWVHAYTQRQAPPQSGGRGTRT